MIFQNQMMCCQAGLILLDTAFLLPLAGFGGEKQMGVEGTGEGDHAVEIQPFGDDMTSDEFKVGDTSPVVICTPK